MNPKWNAAALLLPSALAIACAGTALADPPDELVAAAQKEGQLNVIALPRDWCGYGTMIDAFKEKYGLTVNELNPDAGSTDELDAIKAARSDPTLQAPDVIDVGHSFGLSAKEEGLLQSYKVSTWDTIPDTVKDADGFWYGDYYGVLAFEINADLVPNAPQDWSDLLAPEYRNQVALAGDPLVSNQAIQAVYAAGLSSADGNREWAAGAGLEFLAELHRRGNLVPMFGDSDLLIQGTTPILLRWDYLALADRDKLEGKANIEVVMPKSANVAGVYVQAISATAPHPNAAKLWMEYLYSDEGQLTWLNGYCHPVRFDDLVRNGKVSARQLERLPDFKEREAAEPVFPTAEEQERAKDIIVNGWDDIVGVKIECPPPPVKLPLPPTSLNNVPIQASELP